MPRPKQVLAAASFLCLGLSPLLALPLLAHLGPALDLGAPDSLSRLADYLSRKVYSSSRELYEGWASWAFLRERVLHLVGHFLAFPGILALPLGLLGFLKAVGRMRALAIPLGLLLAILGLYPSVPETFWTLDRFLLPADILLCLFAGLGVRELAAGFAVRRRVLLAWVLGLLLLLGTAAQIPGKFLQGQTLRYDYAANLLKAAPRNSLLFGEADEDAFPLYYFQEVLGKRKDVRMIPSFLLFEDWGVSHFSRHFPELGLSGPQAFPQDPIGRLGGAVSDLWVRNRGKRPIVFSRFQGALHLYVLPAYPSLRYRPLGLLGALEASGLGRASAPGDLRLRHWDGLASNRDPSLEGIRRAYLDLGLAPSAPVEPGP